MCMGEVPGQGHGLSLEGKGNGVSPVAPGQRKRPYTASTQPLSLIYY